MKKLLFVISIFILINSCKKNEIENTPNVTTAEKVDTVLGAKFGGGVVFYIDSTGKHGLISLLNDPLSPGFGKPWDTGTNKTTNANGRAIGTGASNTNLIVNVQGNYSNSNYAAIYCYNLVMNGFDDWFLPSVDELKQLKTMRYIVGGFTNNSYWSSSETNIGCASFVIFDTTYTSGPGCAKSNRYLIRPIRSF